MRYNDCMELFMQNYLETRRAVVARDFTHLNDRQVQAVLATEGPLLILAGAGSGKTTVLINRVANLLKFGRASDSDELPPDADEEKLAVMSLRLEKNEIVIFEGIHALNDSITNVHPEAFKLYVSARSNITDGEEYLFKGTWLRLVRRMVRDFKFRGADPQETMGMWANVRAGEKKNISPFKDKANLQIDTAFPYEVCVMRSVAEHMVLGKEKHFFGRIQQVAPFFRVLYISSVELSNTNGAWLPNTAVSSMSSALWSQSAQSMMLR